jgi:hypothetical protein
MAVGRADPLVTREKTLFNRAAGLDYVSPTGPSGEDEVSL